MKRGPVPASAPMNAAIGDRYGRWVILSFERNKWQRWSAFCRCDCGTKRLVCLASLKDGTSPSCGCQSADFLRQHVFRAAFRHGHASGGRRSPEYKAWASMRRRCENTASANFRLYGGRGIRVCPEWHVFEAFLQDVDMRPGPGYSLDRIDNDGNYEPGNVRWATSKQQCRNTRANRYVELNGRRMTLVECAEQAGFVGRSGYHLIHLRLRRGWSIERAVSTPIRQHTRGTRA